MARPRSSLTAAPLGGDWKLIFRNEFNGTTADLDQNWEVQNGPGSHILCSRWRENAIEKNGLLHLLNKKQARAGQDCQRRPFFRLGAHEHSQLER